MDLDDFVEMTKNYAQGIVPSQESDGQVLRGANKKEPCFSFNEGCLNYGVFP